MQDIGAGKGKYYAVNYPLRDGIDDESYEAIFKPVSAFTKVLCNHHIYTLPLYARLIIFVSVLW